MADAPVLGGSLRKKVKLDDAAFGARFSVPLVHQSVRAEQAARRRGTAATKTRAMVSGGGAKPWRQKGTGRARAGSNRSPIWTGGGTVFGPQPRSYTFKVNRKEQRAALRRRSPCTPSAARSRSSTPQPSRLPDEPAPPSCSTAGNQRRAPTLVVLTEARATPPCRSATSPASRC